MHDHARAADARSHRHHRGWDRRTHLPDEGHRRRLRARGVAPSDLRFVGSRRGQESTLLAARRHRADAVTRSGHSSIAATRRPARQPRRRRRLARARARRARSSRCDGGDRRSWSRSAATPPSRRRWPRSSGVDRSCSSTSTPNRAPRNDSSRDSRERDALRFPRTTRTPSSPARRCATTSSRSIARPTRARRLARRSSRRSTTIARVVVVMTGLAGFDDGQPRGASTSRDAGRAVRDRTLIHVDRSSRLRRGARDAPVTDGLDYRIVDFADMVELWALCDVAICRAGASTVAELTTLAHPFDSRAAPERAGRPPNEERARASSRPGRAARPRRPSAPARSSPSVLDVNDGAGRSRRWPSAPARSDDRDAAASIARVVRRRRRPVVTLVAPGARVHVVGVGGAGMSGARATPRRDGRAT